MSPIASQPSPTTESNSPFPLALQNALGSMTMQLEAELARYRWAKRLGETGVESRSQDARRASHLKSTETPSRSATSAVMPPSLPSNPRLHQPHPTATAPSAASPEVAALRQALVHQPTDDSLPVPGGDPLPGAALQDFQALISEPAAETRPSQPSRYRRYLGTPLGFGLLLLLLSVSAGLGLVLINPALVRPLVSQRPEPSAEEAFEEASGGAEGAGSDGGTSEQGNPPSPLSPDLSRNDPLALDALTLDSPAASGRAADAPPAGLAQTSPSSQSRPPVAGALAEPQVAAVPSSPATVPEAAAPAVPPRRTPAPDPLPADSNSESTVESAVPTAVPQPSEQTAPVSDAVAPPEAIAASQPPTVAYYVVADYTGDTSLSAAREMVEDAYVRNFDSGARIQLGAFKTEAAAATLIEELSNQGITAQVYKP